MARIKQPRIEEIRIILNNLRSNISQEIKSIMVTSTAPGEGKTVLAYNLALMLAQSGSKVVIVDFNQHNPELHNIFSLIIYKGITNYLDDEINYEDLIKNSNKNPLLDVITLGTKQFDFDKLLNSNTLKELFNKLKQDYKYILIDTPAIENIADTLIISQYVDGCLFVIENDKINRKKVIEGKEALIRVNANILGVIINKK